MTRRIADWWKSLGKEVRAHPQVYFFLAIILVGGLFVRVYRLDQLLGFYFDQGRDALVIWRFWHEGDLFLVGPTTGIEGILRGPWYYWLIAPFYLLGGGDPVWPAAFLAFLSVVALALLFKITEEVGGRLAAFLAVIIASFSYYLVLAGRWLSNPTPMLLVGVLLLWAMFRVMDGKKWVWILIAFLLGMAMQFGSAAEIFYFPAILIFAVWQRKHLPDKKKFIFAVILFFSTFLPQIVFDIIHQGILRTAIKRFLFEGESFQFSFWEIAKLRFEFYYQVFFQKLFPVSSRFWPPFLVVGGATLLLTAKELFKNKKFLTTFILAAAPIIGLLFFQGNYWVIYDYYFTGYYLIFVLVFATLLAKLAKRFWGLVLVSIFLATFLSDNLPVLKNYLSAGIDGPTTVNLGSELGAVNWVFSDSQGWEFNADVYVPPVIPYAYDYLFLWQGTRRCGQGLCGLKLAQQVPLLYTPYEVDVPHPERLAAWLARQKGIGKIEEEVKFGGVTVQRRQRLNQP